MTPAVFINKWRGVTLKERSFYVSHFNDLWQFVRYAKEHNFNLDFTTPPKRPDPKGLADRIFKILDVTEAI